MSLSATITPAILDQHLGELAVLFLPSAVGDLPTARHAVGQLLAVHEAETEEELRLAADIVRFGFHALEALDRSMAPGLPGDQVLGLRAGAATFNRRAEAAQHRLDQLKRNRQVPAPEAGACLAANGVADGMVVQQAAGLIVSARLALANGSAPPDKPEHIGHPACPRAAMRHHAARCIADDFIRARSRLARRETTHAYNTALAVFSFP